jgi:hypothetical protein
MKMFKRMISLLLVSIISITFANPERLFAEEVVVNLLNDSTFYKKDESTLDMYVDKVIHVEPNTDYVISLPEDMFESENQGSDESVNLKIYSNNDPWTVLVNTTSFELVGFYNRYYTFNSGSSTTLWISISSTVSSGSDLMTYFDAYGLSNSDEFNYTDGGGMMLTTGTVSHDHYVAAVPDFAPVINGYTGVLLSQQNNPITLDYIKGLLTASDTADGDLTSSIVVTSDAYTPNKSTIGEHSIVFTVEDSASNSTSITVVVKVVDTVKPIITLIGNSVIDLEYGTEECEYFDRDYPGVIITDNVDNDLVAVITSNFNYQALGTYLVNYNVTDSMGNIADTVVLTVNVVDTTPPILDLVGDSTVYVEFGSNYEEPGTTCFDINVSCTASNTGSVNVGVLGTYTLTYTAVDSLSNSVSITRNVIVRDTTKPVFSGNSQLTFVAGSSPLYEDLLLTFTASDTYDGGLTSNIIATAENYSGNENTKGYYNIDLQVTDSSGNLSYLLVEILIEDNTPPVFYVSSKVLTIEEANAMTLQDYYDYFGITN